MRICSRIVIASAISGVFKQITWSDTNALPRKSMPTFNCSGIFAFDATAFLGMVTQTSGYSGRLNEPPLDVML